MIAVNFNNPLKGNYLEVEGMLKASKSRIWQLQKELQLEAARARKLQRLLRENDQAAQNWVLTVPVDLLSPRKVTGKKINWKKLVLETLEQYDTPMTTELLYHKLVLGYDSVPLDRTFVIRNVSAALHYLEARDEKLFRQKDDRKKGFIYGLKHHFTLDLKLKPLYLKRLRLEEGENLEELEQKEIKKAV